MLSFPRTLWRRPAGGVAVFQALPSVSPCCTDSCPPFLRCASVFAVPSAAGDQLSRWSAVYKQLDYFKQALNFPEALGSGTLKNANGNEELLKVAAQPVDKRTLEIKEETSMGSQITKNKNQQPLMAPL